MIFYNEIKILQEALDSIDSTSIVSLVEDSVATTSSGNKIVFAGLGKNEPICIKAVGSLNSFSIPSSYVNINTALHGDLGLISNNDLLIILSKSANNYELIEFLKRIYQKELKIWIISANKNFKNHLPNLSSTIKGVIYNLNHEGDLWNLAPMNSSTINMVIINKLITLICEKLHINKETFMKNHPGGAIGLNEFNKD
jgi:D-arabinose 5-phosphate isomerase GutQ